jgi:hypothetical protein
MSYSHQRYLRIRWDVRTRLMTDQRGLMDPFLGLLKTFETRFSTGDGVLVAPYNLPLIFQDYI